MRYMKRGLMGVVAAGAFLGAACGGSGGGTGGSGNPGGGSETNFGAVSINALGTLSAPVVVPSPGYTMLGFGGATITNAVVNFPPVTQVTPEVMFDNSWFVASVNDHAMGVDLVSGDAYPLGDGGMSDDDTQPTVFLNGPRVATSEWDPATGGHQIYSIHRDGTGRTRLTSDAGAQYREPANANAFGILFVDTATNKLMRLPNGSSTPAAIYDDGASYRRPSVSIDGSRVAVIRDSDKAVMVGHPDGSGTLVEAYVSPDNTSQLSTTWLPNGDLLIADPSGGTTMFLRYTPSTDQQGIPIFADGAFTSIAAAPDGITVALSDGTDQLQALSLASGLVKPFMQMDGPTDTVSWGPYERVKYLVGANSWNTPQAAGFLLTQEHSRVGSYVTFNATTPSGVTITPQGGNISHTLVATIEANDAITSLKYTASSASVNPQVVVTASNPVKGAIVSFNADDGLVASIITYSSSSLTGLTRAVQGNTLTFKGKFEAVWNGKGQNTHTGGVTTVKIDARTGKLLSAE